MSNDRRPGALRLLLQTSVPAGTQSRNRLRSSTSLHSHPSHAMSVRYFVSLTTWRQVSPLLSRMILMLASARRGLFADVVGKHVLFGHMRVLVVERGSRAAGEKQKAAGAST